MEPIHITVANDQPPSLGQRELFALDAYIDFAYMSSEPDDCGAIVKTFRDDYRATGCTYTPFSDAILDDNSIYIEVIVEAFKNSTKLNNIEALLNELILNEKSLVVVSSTYNTVVLVLDDAAIKRSYFALYVITQLCSLTDKHLIGIAFYHSYKTQDNGYPVCMRCTELLYTLQDGEESDESILRKAVFKECTELVAFLINRRLASVPFVPFNTRDEIVNALGRTAINIPWATQYAITQCETPICLSLLLGYNISAFALLEPDQLVDARGNHWDDIVDDDKNKHVECLLCYINNLIELSKTLPRNLVDSCCLEINRILYLCNELFLEVAIGDGRPRILATLLSFRMDTTLHIVEMEHHLSASTLDVLNTNHVTVMLGSFIREESYACIDVLLDFCSPGDNSIVKLEAHHLKVILFGASFKQQEALVVRTLKCLEKWYPRCYRETIATGELDILLRDNLAHNNTSFTQVLLSSGAFPNST